MVIASRKRKATSATEEDSSDKDNDSDKDSNGDACVATIDNGGDSEGCMAVATPIVKQARPMSTPGRDSKRNNASGKTQEKGKNARHRYEIGLPTKIVIRHIIQNRMAPTHHPMRKAIGHPPGKRIPVQTWRWETGMMTKKQGGGIAETTV